MPDPNGALPNYINGRWQGSRAEASLDVVNPATAEAIAQVPLSTTEDVDEAARHAAEALETWRRTPVAERVQYLFGLKRLLEVHLDELARTVTEECGKTFAESRGELQRGIENVEAACGMPMLMQGYTNEDVASGIDETMIRQPVGVTAAITPFNFPGMIPLWFLPYAIACGNPFILKPSEKVPMTATKIVELLEQLDLPAGVVQLVHGARETVAAVLDHPTIRAVSFVGSTPVARHVYARATAHGKRAQCQGGAKNPVIVLPDADMADATRFATNSAFGCAGQRCLAASLAVTVGDAQESFAEAIAESAQSLNVGYGLDESVEMGPVITRDSQERVRSLIQQGIDEGAKPVVDGRDAQVSGYERGYFLKPTVIDDLDPNSDLAHTEVFGPVLGLMHASTVDEAIQLVNQSEYGNMACLFTRSGAAARKFRYDVEAGNVGINVGVAAPIAYFPFSGQKESFFGDLHGQGRDAVEFYTEKKVVVERWPMD